ncbi:MAG TPA: heme lyase CcmF/NrfE family subunit [Casimicrobiaceae bacterium]|nr:heme lyase CcmF/NrfE family subunit [Casimicrobiaceae bacterium]
MIPELGHFALVVALVVALALSIVPMWGAARRDAALMALARPAATLLFLLVAFAFGCLAFAFVTSDFSVLNVAQHSYSTLPLRYKFAATWGSHEGSLLLWVLMLSGWAFAVAMASRNLPAVLASRVLAVMGIIAVGFLMFLLFTSNPFERLLPAAIEGSDLNPLLQDPGMVVHPPMLYMGYVGFSVAFAFAIAALIGGRLDASWARWSRPWTTLAWCFLTMGIALGSAWAYYTLGWGGWWFWDPVENASLMPWLAGTALLHSAVVMEKRNSLKVWTILLAILTFSLSLIGTFLVRSGVLTSVHAFASDPMRGVFILAILVTFIGGGLALFAWRAPLLRQGGLFAPVSREGALVLNNLLLSAACATVFVGTLYPLALEALTGEKISVGPPFFNATFGPLFAALLIALPFGPLLAWKRGDLAGVAQRLSGAFVVALIGVAATFVVEGRPLLAPFGIGLALFVIAGAVTDIVERTGLLRAPLMSVARRAAGLRRSAWGTAFAHLGLGITLLGIVGETQWNAERIVSVKPGERIAVRNYDFTFDGTADRNGPNFKEVAATFTVRRHGEVIGVMTPAKRTFGSRSTTTTESALMARGFSQLYLSLGDINPDGSAAVRLYYKPLVLLIWLGCIVMVIGGGLSLSDRRLRVGAPKPARVKPAMVPAE